MSHGIAEMLGWMIDKKAIEPLRTLESDWETKHPASTSRVPSSSGMAGRVDTVAGPVVVRSLVTEVHGSTR